MSKVDEIDVFRVPEHQLADVIDRGIRHKADATPSDYLHSFLRISRPLAYATRDGTWQEFEKEFTTIVCRMVKAERAAEAAGLPGYEPEKRSA